MLSVINKRLAVQEAAIEKVCARPAPARYIFYSRLASSYRVLISTFNPKDARRPPPPRACGLSSRGPRPRRRAGLPA